MATFGFSVYLAWKGDEDRGRAIEKIVNAAFAGSDEDDTELEEGVDREQVKTLREVISQGVYKKTPITGGFDDYNLFGDYEEPRTVYFQREENRNSAQDCFEPLFKRFSDIEFWAQCQQDYVSSGDSYEYTRYIYQNGAVVDVEDDDYSSYDKYCKRCQKGDWERLKWLGLAYIQADRDVASSVLGSAPEKFKTPELCLAAV